MNQNAQWARLLPKGAQKLSQNPNQLPSLRGFARRLYDLAVCFVAVPMSKAGVHFSGTRSRQGCGNLQLWGGEVRFESLASCNGEREKMRRKSSLGSVLLMLFGALTMTHASAQESAETQGPTTLSETYDAWTVQCANALENEQTRRICQMSQELLQQETRQRVLLVAITKQGDESARGTLVMPFGLLLSEGIRMELGENELIRGSYRTCLPAGCVVELTLPDAVIAELQNGEEASLVMTANSGQQVRTNVSLKGFTAAYSRLMALAASN